MKIEAGKYYRDSLGTVVGPMEDNGVARVFPFKGVEHQTGKTRIVTSAGRYNSDGEPHKLDLVEEWPQEAHTVEPVAIDPEDGTYTAQQWADYNAAPVLAEVGYEALAGILSEAHDQAATGKGKERHANDRPFDRQPILEIGRMVGPGFDVGQAMKKQQEAMGMLKRGDADAAIRELLGAINYTAAAILLIREL